MSIDFIFPECVLIGTVDILKSKSSFFFSFFLNDFQKIQIRQIRQIYFESDRQ